MVVTGASAGIGAEAAIVLAAAGDTVVLVGRSPEKLARVADRVRAASGRTPASYACDYADLDDVRHLGGRLATEYDAIDVLAHNAGLVTKHRQYTVDGHEVTIQVNHLAPFLLTHLLWRQLEAAPAARVVTTSSAAHVAGRLDLDDLDYERRRWTPMRAYADSKQANILFTVALARRLQSIGGTATAFHPGTIASDFGDEMFVVRLGKRVARGWIFSTPESGARRLVQLAATDDGRTAPGGYFVNGRLARAARAATDPRTADRLWERSAELVN